MCEKMLNENTKRKILKAKHVKKKKVLSKN